MSDLLNRIDLRYDFIAEKLAQHVITEDGCWEYQGAKREDGYGYLTICSPHSAQKKRKFRIHRVAYAFYTGVDPSELLVCHHCDNRACINPDHLFLGTTQANSADMVIKGRAANQEGDRNHAAKLTKLVVLNVLDLIKEGRGNVEIAQELPVSHHQVSLIRHGKSWRSVTQEAGYDPEQYRFFTRRKAENSAA